MADDETASLVPSVKHYNGCCTRMRSSRHLVVTIVFLAVMLDVLLMTVVDPILPDMMNSLDNSHTLWNASRENKTRANQTQTEDTRTRRATEIGVIVAAKPFFEMLTNVFVGYLVDRVGHRGPMLLGFGFNFAATVGFAYAPNFTLLLTTRLLQAVGSSLSVVAGLAFLAISFPEDEERAKANGRAFTGISLGVILGYPFGCTIYQFLGRAAPFLILAGLNLVDGLLRLCLITPSHARKGMFSSQKINRVTIRDYCRLLKDPFILVALGFGFVQHFGLGIFLATGPAWMLFTLKAQQWEIGAVLASAVVFHLLATLVTGWFALRIGRWIFCLVGLLLFGTGMILYPLCQTIWQVFGPEIAVRIGHGTVLCVISPLLGHIADIRHRSNYGATYGLYTASYNFGLSAGPVVGGLLANTVPFEWIYRATGIVIVMYSATSIVFRHKLLQQTRDAAKRLSQQPIARTCEE